MDYVIGKGTVPILITKADSMEAGYGDLVINPAIVRVARDYDVPVVNFWRSAQSLENGGIDPAREGFHLSPEGFKLKNILALRALYRVWTQIEQWKANPSTLNASETPTVTPTLTATPASQTETPVQIPDCTGGCLYAGSAVSRDGVVASNGVLVVNYATGELTQILGEGYDLQDVSEDGLRLLVNDADNLYELSLQDGAMSLISDTFFSFGEQDAYWNADDSQVVYLDRDLPIQTETGEAYNLFPSTLDGEIYFESGSCTKKADCQSDGVYHRDSNLTITKMDSYSQMAFSPDGSLVAFLDPSAATTWNYYHIPYLLTEKVDQGLSSRRQWFFPAETGFMVNPEVRRYAFSPDSKKLFILYDIYSDYFERSIGLHLYSYDIDAVVRYDYGTIDGSSGSLNPRLAWSPQSDNVVLFLIDTTDDNQYSLSLYQIDPEIGKEMVSFVDGIMTSEDYFYITSVYWR
jgi:hypothetical protein